MNRSAQVADGVVVYRLDDVCSSRTPATSPRASPTSTAPGSPAVEELVEHLRKDGNTLVTARMKSPIRQRFGNQG